MRCLLCLRNFSGLSTAPEFSTHLQAEHKTTAHKELLYQLSLLNKENIEEIGRIARDLNRETAVEESDPLFDNAHVGNAKIIYRKKRKSLSSFQDEVFDIKTESREKTDIDQLEYFKIESSEIELYKLESDDKETYTDSKNDEAAKIVKTESEPEKSIGKPPRGKNGFYSPEERQWCIDKYQLLTTQGIKWHTELSEQFKARFPTREHAPSPKAVAGFVEKMEKYNTTENRWNTKGRPTKHRSNICDHCGLVVGSRANAMYMHLRRHHGEEKPCEECGDMVNTFHMNAHIRLKHREKQFHCSICGKSFRYKQHMQDHETIHSDIRGYPCKFLCGYASKTSTNIAKHEKHCRLNIL